MDDLRAWEEYFRGVFEVARDNTLRLLEQFRESLEDWLHAQLNWPSPDWEAQLQVLDDHTRYYGLDIQPHALAALRELIAARVNGTGPFAIFGSYDFDHPSDEPQVQLAMAVTLDDGTRTDATTPLAPEPEPSFENGREVAGPDPQTTWSFQEKVQLALELMDADVASWWKQLGGMIRSRSATGWFTFMRENYYSFMEDGRPVVVVDQHYTVGQTAQAIVDEARRGPATSIQTEFTKHWLHGKDTAERLKQLQRERFKEGAAFAGWAAEAYYNAIGSVTPAGDVVVTIDDAGQNGLRWDHLLVLLPLMSHFRKGLKKLIIQLPRGRKLELSGEIIDRLIKLDPPDRAALIAKARAAKSQDEALAIIEEGVGIVGKGPGHHIATNKNWISTLRGGPWSPRFQKIFDRAGMTLKDAENIVNIPGHAGPHPEAYHQEIFDRLTAATAGKSKAPYKESLVAELRKIAREVRTSGTG